MNQAIEKTYLLNLTESELYALTEGISEAVEESAMTGNNITEFIEMVKCHTIARPTKGEESRDIIRNYTTINNLMLFHRNELLKVISKAEAIVKTIQ